MKRVFLGHPKDLSSLGFTDTDLPVIRGCVAEAIRSGDPFAVVTGRDDYLINEARTGGFQGWPLDVVERVDVMNGKPWYDLFLVLGCSAPPFRVGRATADIVSAALALRRRVAAVTVVPASEGALELFTATFYALSTCRQVEKKNWQTGWEVS